MLKKKEHFQALCVTMCDVNKTFNYMSNYIY